MTNFRQLKKLQINDEAFIKKKIKVNFIDAQNLDSMLKIIAKK